MAGPQPCGDTQSGSKVTIAAPQHAERSLVEPSLYCRAIVLELPILIDA